MQRAVQHRTGQTVPVIVIQEAGLDGFWIHRALIAAGIESHVVDPASVAVSRRHRRAKTDRIDGEALVRTLMAWRRGEPRVCAMVRVPTPEEEDRRRVCRELKVLIGERIRHVNRVKGVLFTQGIGDYEPRNKDRRNRLEELRTGDGHPLPHHLKALVLRELEIIELLNQQIETVKAERNALLAEAQITGSAPTPVRMLLALKGIGPGFAGALWSEGLFRTFKNRRQVAAYAGLAPTPWKSGTINHEQGVSKAGNPRLRAIAVEMAWLWLRHQPGSALARWFHDRVRRLGARAKKVTIVALARKLLVALWKYVTSGIVIEGAAMKTV
ncbi:MAG TPA: IS110 family transposase [Aurantimonas coralicida]|uniref:IS110 family transposase n=1 Tax=Aurantimonas coralicida TaxID=182270 RepID=A0A9C9TH88_9HYPH|nr:IS110 family transposase [Aurantimonas coralicida]HEU01260.1 IS110 family transposase [Aurantimonas coralicida]